MSMHIYLSPHLDDAALSCAGRMAAQVAAGERVRVINIFAGVPDYTELSAYAQRQHTKWGHPPDPVGLRRAEDRRVLEGLGVEVENWDDFDCIYRATTNRRFLYNNHAEVFGQVHPAEALLVAQIAVRLGQAHHSQPDATFYAPLGVGGHVDHQVVRTAAVALRVLPASLVFYEDFPYAAKEGGVEAALAGLPFNFVGELIPIDVDHKIATIAGYASQIYAVFGDAAGLDRTVRMYAGGLGPEGGFHEQYWRVLD